MLGTSVARVISIITLISEMKVSGVLRWTWSLNLRDLRSMHIQVVIKIYFIVAVMTARPFTGWKQKLFYFNSLAIFDSFSFPAFVFWFFRFPFTTHLHSLWHQPALFHALISLLFAWVSFVNFDAVQRFEILTPGSSSERLVGSF